MNQPVSAVQEGRSVLFYAVAAPGVDPASIKITPDVRVLGWKFANYEGGDLIDIVAEVDKHMKALSKWVEAARGVLKQKLPVPADPGTETVTPGRLFEAHYTKSIRMDIDRDKVKAHFGDEYPKYCKQTEVLMLKIVPITQTPGAEVSTSSEE